MVEGIDPTYGWSRVNAVVQVLGAAIGLGTYVALAGGISEWARLAGAGLPATQALASIEPITLLASGFQVLVLVPLIVATMYFADRVATDLRRSPREIRALKLAQRGQRLLAQSGVLVGVTVATILPFIVVLGLAIRAETTGNSSVLWVSFILALVLVHSLLLAGTVPARRLIRAVRIVGQLPAATREIWFIGAREPKRVDVSGPRVWYDGTSKPKTRRARLVHWVSHRRVVAKARRQGITLATLSESHPTLVGAIPAVARYPLAWQIAHPRLAGSLATVVAVVAFTPVALEALPRDTALGPFRADSVDVAWLTAAMVLLWALYIAAMLGIAGVLALRTAISREQEAKEDASLTAAEREARNQASLSLYLAILLIGGIVIAPLAWGVFLVTLCLIVTFVRADPGQDHRLTKALLLSATLALGLMGYQAHAPQRFDLLRFSVPGEGDEKTLSVRVALVGTRGDSYAVAACDRKPFELLDQPRWESTNPVFLHFAKDDAVDASVVSRDYTFLQRRQPSILGVIVSYLDLGITVPAPFTTANTSGSPGAALAKDVCGGVDQSATNALAALAALRDTAK